MRRVPISVARRHFRAYQTTWKPDDRLPVPSWLPYWLADRIHASCQSCQDFMDMRYGSAECSSCPLANLASRLIHLHGNHV